MDLRHGAFDEPDGSHAVVVMALDLS